MNIRRLRNLVPICLAILVLNQSYPGLGRHVDALVQSDSAWVAFVPPDEEFTVTVPARPTTRTYPTSNYYKTDQERILAHREYGGYGNGLIFIIHSYKAERPQRLSGGLLNLTDQSAALEREISIDGVAARLYRSPYSNRYATYTKHMVRFISKQHLYLVTLVTLEETNPVVDRFLSSLRLRRPEDQVTPVGPSAENILTNVFNPNEVTRHAIIVWKSEPWYTDEARAHRVKGTVTLEAVFAEDGYVANITVSKGLKDGLTENAIDAARNIRFFPAEKDGRLVSQRTMLEYSFDLY